MLFDSIIVLILIPTVTYLISFIKDDGTSIYKNFMNNKYNKIIFTGWDSLSNGMYCFDYPYPMIAICHYIIKNNLSNNIRQFNQERNRVFDLYDINKSKVNKEEDVQYIIDSKMDIKLIDDIYVDFSIQRINTEISKEKNSQNWKVTLLIKSMTKSIQEIKEFIEKITKEYNEYDKIQNENKIFHFIYQGVDEINDSKLKFNKSILSDFKNDSEKNFESFDTIFSEHKNTIIKTINRLKDFEYFKRTGAKRKAGFLFYGPPGCGKTCHVNAIANYDKRHIIEIPMSRIKTNKELEIIINLSQINDINFKKDEIILFFDEIDQGSKILAKRDGENEESEKEDGIKDLMLKSLLSKKSNNEGSIFSATNEDSLNLGCVLSRLDGIGNYNGLIIIASTNCKDNLSPALYRSGRLSPMFFDFCRREDIVNMIEFNYNIELSKDQISKLPDKTHSISPATLRKYIDDEENVDKLINLLNQNIK